MAKSLKGSQTEQNLLKSFAGESQARNRYEFFASVAKKEGYVQISRIFLETALQEKEHAKRFFKFLEGGMIEITAPYPAGKIGTTIENLKAAAEGENEEWSILYPAFAKVAEEEGFKEVSAAFKMIAKAEAEHEKDTLSFSRIFLKTRCSSKMARCGGSASIADMCTNRTKLSNFAPLVCTELSICSCFTRIISKNIVILKRVSCYRDTSIFAPIGT